MFIKSNLHLTAPSYAKNKLQSLMVSVVTAFLLLLAGGVSSLFLSPEQVANSFGLSCFIYSLYLSLSIVLVGALIKVLRLSTVIRRCPIPFFWGVLAGLLAVRFLAIRFQFPSLFFATVFFTSPGADLPGMYAQNMGTLFMDVCQFMALTTIGLKYFSSYHRSFIKEKRWLSGALITLDFFIVLGLFFVLPFIASEILAAGTIELNSSRFFFFNFYSFMAIFVLFGLSYGAAMGMNKILRVLYCYWGRNMLHLCLHTGICFVLFSTLLIGLFPFIGGYPTWVCALFLLVLLVVAFVWGKRERNNYRFFPVVSKLILFSLFVALMTSHFVKQKQSDLREQMVAELEASVTSFSQKTPIDTRSLLDSIYPKKTLQIAYAWVAKTPKFIDRKVVVNYARDAALYSFAYYDKGLLVDQCGGCQYLLNSNYYLDLLKDKSNTGSVSLDGRTHHLYPLKNGDLIIISEKNLSRFDFLAAFSLFFMLYLVFYVVLLFLCWATVGIRWTLSFYNALLWGVLLLMLLVGLAVGLIAIYTADKRASSDRSALVQVKMGIVEKQLTQSIGTFPDEESDAETMRKTDSLLRQLSEAYCLELMLYDTEGQLLRTSNLDSSMVRKQMPNQTLAKMRDGNSYWSEASLTDYMDILEMYKVVMNADGQVVGYFCASDLRNRYSFDEKLSNMVTRCLVIYAWLILFAILGAVLVYVIGTLSMRKLGRALRGRNRPFSPIRLEWEVSEEIGQLISEHNNMVETLRSNAIQMAKSERETAWREMALEIAHEVKNPLTPMRLKLQMLQRAWLSNKPDFAVRFNESTEEVLRQVEVLSEVADTFSEFASTQLSFNHDVDLKVLLTELADELAPNLTTTYDFQLVPETECRSYVDRKQFKQMVYNLVKNSDHNRMDNGRLDISIRLEDAPEADAWLLTFHANDRGLDITDEAIVFTVKFSSENCGHSLCLPIVRNIVAGFGGEISVRTAPDSGTTFYVKIPKL